MSQPPADPASDSTGPADRQTLRLLERHLSSDSLIAETAFDPVHTNLGYFMDCLRLVDILTQ